jgi:hypothetical protein
VNTPTGSGDPVTGQTGDAESIRKFEQDLARCERLLSFASATGVRMFQEDIRAVLLARKEKDRGLFNEEIAKGFYAAMSRIAARAHYPSSAVSEDMQHCEELISYAAQTGKDIQDVSLKDLSEARQARTVVDWTPDQEDKFYKAMSRVAKAVAPAIAETLGEKARRGARRAIRLYTWGGVFLTIIVLGLSALLFVVQGISSDISTVVGTNDAAALTLHNRLQAYTASIDEANDKGTLQAIELVQNSPAATEIKEQMQQFAKNNRQLYSDVSRTNGIVAFFLFVPRLVVNKLLDDVWKTNWGEAKNRYYKDTEARYNGNAEGCPKQSPRGEISVNVYPLSFPTYLFTMGTGATPPPGWDCDETTRRQALEIDLPLFKLGTRPETEAETETPPKTGALNRASSKIAPDATAVIRRYMPEDTVNQGFQKLAVYQDIRVMAVYAKDIILSVVGAITGFLLPILYAWLGACAAILRHLQWETSQNIFHPEHSKVANRSHITTAVIVGIAIGLFSNLLHGGTETSPLALAFVAGYASDKFFEFIDRLVESIFPSDISGKRPGARKGRLQRKPQKSEDATAADLP